MGEETRTTVLYDLDFVGHVLQVDKYDDPNTAVNKLMLALTGMGFDLNFPANRLKQVGLPHQ